MPKKPKDRKVKIPPKPKRNPHARALASPLFQGKVETRPDAYRRRPKHPPPLVTDEDDT